MDWQVTRCSISIIEGEEKYELVIYDRWGVKVFESKDKTIDWNGKVMNDGALCLTELTINILNYRFKGLERMSQRSTVIVRIMR
jgi:hypothetical protein